MRVLTTQPMSTNCKLLFHKIQTCLQITELPIELSLKGVIKNWFEARTWSKFECFNEVPTLDDRFYLAGNAHRRLPHRLVHPVNGRQGRHFGWSSALIAEDNLHKKVESAIYCN